MAQSLQASMRLPVTKPAEAVRSLRHVPLRIDILVILAAATWLFLIAAASARLPDQHAARDRAGPLYRRLPAGGSPCRRAALYDLLQGVVNVDPLLDGHRRDRRRRHQRLGRGRRPARPLSASSNALEHFAIGSDEECSSSLDGIGPRAQATVIRDGQEHDPAYR